MQRKLSSYQGSQTTRSRIRSTTPKIFQPVEFVIKQTNSTRVSQFTSPKRTISQFESLPTQQFDLLTTISSIKDLRARNLKTQTDMKNILFWNKVEDLKPLTEPQTTDFERLKRNTIYKKLRDMKQKEEDTRKRNQSMKEAEIRAQKLKEKKERIKNLIVQPKKPERKNRFHLFTIVNALTLIQIHSKQYSLRLPKLVAKHYLNILDFNYFMEQKAAREAQSNSNTPKTVNLGSSKILEIQDLVNGGIIRVQCENKTVKHREYPKAAEIFSEDVLRRVRLLQSCFHLKVFSRKSKSHKYRRPQLFGVPSSRVKALTKRLDDIRFLNQQTPKQLQQQLDTQHHQSQKIPKKSLRLFRSISKGSLTNQKSLFFNRQNTNEFLLRGVQMLHYPIIKYISIFYGNMIVWSISYKDITLDKSCIILFFKGEGRFKFRYRLDVPIGKNAMIDYSENCLTVWPTVRDYLISYLELKGQLTLLDIKQLPSASLYKLNFLKGLTERSRLKLTSLDIHAITETKRILDYLQKSQIVRIRKIFGTTYELLPQFVEINKYGQKKQYIINLPLVHNIVLQLRMFEAELLLQKRNFVDVEENLIDQYKSFIDDHFDQINQIIIFRFVHNNPRFFNDQMLSAIQKLDEKQVYIQSASIKLKDILQIESNTDHVSVGSYCLLSIFVKINCPVLLKLLLLDVVDKSQLQNLSDTIGFFEYIIKRNQLNIIFNQKYFQILIKVSFYERDEAGYRSQYYQSNLYAEKQDRKFKELTLTVEEWLKLCMAIKKTLLPVCSEQFFDFNKLVKYILLEQSFYSQIAEETLKQVFCVSLKTQQVILKPSFKHILSSSHSFLEQLDSNNFLKRLGYVHKYSIYPTEYQDLRLQTVIEHKTFIEPKVEKQFNKQFKKINTNDFKLSSNVSKLTLYVDYQYEYHMTQSMQVDYNQLDMASQFSFSRKYVKYQIVNKRDGMSLVRLKLFCSPIIVKIEDEDLIFKILNCSHLPILQRNQQLCGYINAQYCKNSFSKNNYHFFEQKNKRNLPNYGQIKFMLINDTNKLLNYLDRINFMFLFKQNFGGQKILVHAKVYFLCKDSHQKNNEKIYFFQKEHLFLSLEIQEFKSKLKKYIIIMNKYDLDQMFELSNYLDISIVHSWCRTIIGNLSFDKQNIYRLPYLQNLNQYIMPKLEEEQDGQVLKTQKSMTNQYKHHHDEQNHVSKQFLKPQIKLFRVIGHYVEKYYLLQSDNKYKLVDSLASIQKSEYDNISTEFVIITIQAHNIFDMFKIIYYFPKSKRKLMTYISILQFQEMDFRDNLIFDLLDFKEYKTYLDIEKYLKSLKQGTHLKHSVQLDRQVLTKLKFMKQSVEMQHPFQFAYKRNQKNFFKVSDDLITKNRYILTQIKQNQSLSKKVIEFMLFTRNLNKDLSFEMENRLIEIKIWELLLQQVFELKYKTQKQMNSYFHLIDRIISTFDSQKRNQIKIIGKEYLLKQQSSGTLKNNYTVQSNVTQMYTRLILTHNIKVTEKFKFPETDLILNIGSLQHPLLEFVCSEEIKLERLGNAYMECFIEQQKKPQQNQKIFKPQSLITYSQSSDYNIYLRYYCLQNLKYKDVRLNMRELLNLFIADGFFKSKTNYMNSRLSQADIQNMCFYLEQKIRDQNYLNLSSLVLLKKEKKFSLESQILLETQDTMIPEQNNSFLFNEGYFYTHNLKVKNLFKVMQLQIFTSTKRIVVSVVDSKAIQFEQEVYSFKQADHLVPYFIVLVQNKKIFQALYRLAVALENNYKK